jgi:amidase
MRAIFVAVILCVACAVQAVAYDPTEKDIATLQRDMAAGRVTSEALVKAYVARIERIDRSGPELRSVIAINPNAIADARTRDAERRAGHIRGPLHGIPILVKDNIETADPMPTTAGSLALAGNITHRDAPVVARLRAAGAVILGKANLSEWANIRSAHGLSGWSAIGGLVKNPYVLDRSACGSSSGSGAAVASSLAAAALGTETDGSLVCPGSINGIVALKPTVGLLSRTHIVPISHTQDTPGPMARSVADAAALLTVMAGSDAADPATAPANAHRTDYSAALANASLRGMRLGYIARDPNTPVSETDAVFAQAIAALKNAGAEIVEIKDFKLPQPEYEMELTVLLHELKADMNTYLAGLPAPQRVHSLADVIAFDRSDRREMALFGQDLFEQAEGAKDLSDPGYLKAHEALQRSSRETLDKLLASNRLDALIRATDEPSFRIDVVKGDNDSSNASFLPATAGYPHLTVPMGFVHQLPIGLSFTGPPWSEAKLLAMGYAFEQTTHARRPPHFVLSLESRTEIQKAFAPASVH